MATHNLKNPVFHLTALGRAKLLRYISDIQAGLVPSDQEYDAVYEAIARNGGTDFSRLTNAQVAKMAGDIRAIRT